MLSILKNQQLGFLLSALLISNGALAEIGTRCMVTENPKNSKVTLSSLRLKKIDNGRGVLSLMTVQNGQEKVVTSQGPVREINQLLAFTGTGTEGTTALIVRGRKGTVSLGQDTFKLNCE